MAPSIATSPFDRDSAVALLAAVAAAGAPVWVAAGRVWHGLEHAPARRRAQHALAALVETGPARDYAHVVVATSDLARAARAALARQRCLAPPDGWLEVALASAAIGLGHQWSLGPEQTAYLVHGFVDIIT